MSEMSVMSVMKSIVPITRFNKGEANRIFEEVEHCGTKIVMKNNRPACIIFAPFDLPLHLHSSLFNLCFYIIQIGLSKPKLFQHILLSQTMTWIVMSHPVLCLFQHDLIGRASCRERV